MNSPVIKKCRGLTLLELMIFCALFTLLAVATMRTLGESRMVRGRARDRSAMALIAQAQIEHARLLPASELREGETTVTNPEWPKDVEAVVKLARQKDNLWLVDVSVRRSSIEGKAEVTLATLRPGGSQ